MNVHDYPSRTVETTFSSTILKFVYFLVVNNNKYLPDAVDSIIFGIGVPNYPSRTVETTMTNSKLRNSDSAYSL